MKWDWKLNRCVDYGCVLGTDILSLCYRCYRHIYIINFRIKNISTKISWMNSGVFWWESGSVLSSRISHILDIYLSITNWNSLNRLNVGTSNSTFIKFKFASIVFASFLSLSSLSFFLKRANIINTPKIFRSKYQLYRKWWVQSHDNES